jgi:hypothetical protein
MRKVTIFFIAIIVFASFYEVKAQIDYHQGWEDAGAGLAGWVNTGTGGNFARFSDVTVCTGEASVRANLWSPGHLREFTSPSLGASNGQMATLTFEYKVAVWSANVVGSPCEDFTIEVFWSNSPVGPWTSLGIIDCDNHIVSGECAPAPGVYQFTPGAGDTYIRFTTTWFSGDFYVNFDEVSVIQDVIAGAPEEPFDPSPANGATGVPYDGQLTWTFGDNTDTYDLMFGTAGNMVTVVDNAVADATGSYSFSGLNDFTTYFWQVIAKNDVASVPGPVWNFTTIFSGGFLVIYTDGDIETDYQSPWVGPSTCPGVMTVNVPAGQWITGIDVSYNMTAQNGAWMSEQRSKIYSPTMGAGEADYAAGAGTAAGTFSYSRTGLTFANGAQGEVVFHMDAGRTWGSTAPNDGCGVFYNKVDNGTWTMVIYTSEANYAAISGFVTEAVRGPIEGALITAGPYSATSDANGFYEMPEVFPGIYDVTVVAEGFLSQTAEGVEAIAGETTELNFQLGFPTIAVTPESLYQELEFGETAVQQLMISNPTGTGPLTWSLSIEATSGERQTISIPPAYNTHTPDPAGASAGKAPFVKGTETKGTFNLFRGTDAYAFDMFPGNDFVGFDTDTPGTFSFVVPTTFTVFAADFDQNNVFYAIDNATSNLYIVDVATGDFTLVGPSLAVTDLAFDYTSNTMFGAFYNGASSDLYSIDLATGAATMIGNIGPGIMISMACDGAGQLYGFSISDDNIYSIDKTTGTGTLIGPAGFDGNFAQSMAWDPQSDIIYMAAYNNTLSQGELRVVDKNTGATALIGAFAGGAEVCGLGFMGSPVTWLSANPVGGVVEPGETVMVDITFDATEIFEIGLYNADITVSHNGQPVGDVVVPATLNMTNIPFGTVEGFVTQAVAESAPIEGAHVAFGDYEAFTDANGFYQVELVLPGIYSFTVEAEGYFTQEQTNVVVLANETTTVSFELGYASIEVDPDFIEEELEPNGTSVQLLTISNPTGTEPLTWSASLLYLSDSFKKNLDPNSINHVAALAPNQADLANNNLTSTFDMGTWNTNHTRYITNNPTRELLWNNGPFITHPGGGAGGNDVSALQTNIGMGTFGSNFNHAIAPGSHYYFADDFEVTGTWTLNTMKFFGYQTGSSTTSTFTGIYVQIWDGIPNDPGSSVVWGDLTTNRFVSTAWTGVYRTLDTELTNTARPIMEVVANLDALILTEGVYWVQFGATGSLTSGPWGQPVTILGETTTGNAIQATPTGWVDLIDVGTQGLPFEIYGAGQPPWVSLELNAGIVNPGESQVVEVYFNAEGLVDTTYYADINIMHNALQLAKGMVTVPVELTVASLTPPEAAILLTPENNSEFVSLQPDFSWINGPRTAQTRLVITQGVPPFGQTIFTSPWLLEGESLSLSDYGVELNPKQNYNWRVLARNAAGTVPSDQFTFQTIGAGSIAGSVTDGFSGEPMEGVTITAEELRFSAVTGPDGSYFIENVVEGIYTLEASFEGYIPDSQVVEVVHGANVIANFQLDLFLAPPLSLQAQVSNVFDVNLSWLSPFATEPVWIHWDDGENFDAIGLTGEGGTFSVAARFIPDQISPYDGFGLTTIAFFANSELATYTLKVWKGADQASLVEVHSQPVTTFTNEAWNEIMLTTAVTVDASQELWFGYEVTHGSGQFPAGCDAGPAVAGFGDMIAISGGAWDALSIIAPSLNYNWNLQGYLDPSVKGTAGGSTPYVISNMTAGEPMAAKRGPVENAVFVKNEATRDLTGFNIYRDEVLIGSTTLAVTEFEDLALDPGTYSYTVKAVYPQGESEPAGPRVVSILAPPTLLVAEQVGPEVYLEWESNFVGKGDNIIEGEFHSTSAGRDRNAVTSKEEKLHGPTVRVPQSTGSRAIGDDCLDPIIVGALPYTDVNTTCGRGNNYDETCLGLYDGGEDIIYQLVLTESTVLEITMSTTTTYTGMLISDECPPLTCIASGSNSGTGGVTLIEELAAGTYYIMIDTWPAPDCIPDFTLTIEEIIPDPGQTCGTAVTAVEGLNTAPSAPFWYEFTPAVDGQLTISSCLDGQLIDTDLVVWDACGGNIVAANDDLGAACGFYQFASAVSFPAQAGVSYKIQWLDTWTTDGFDFLLELGDLCVVDCPPDAIAEGELCGEDLNGGCNADVPVFESIAIGDVICGTAWADGSSRDTDWFEVVIDTPQTLTWSATAEFPLLIFIIDGNNGCDGLSILGQALADPCETAEVSATVSPGTYWLWVGPSLFEGYPCGTANNYVAELTAEDAFIPFFTVYRDGDAIADVFGTTYFDTDVMPGGDYCYTVTESPQFELETGFSNELCVNIPLYGELAVNPASLFEVHDPSPDVTTQTIILTNDGDGVMDFEIGVQLLDDGAETSGLCVDPITFTSGCSFGDGITSWSLANVNIPDIPCTGTPAWYKDYTAMVHELEAGETYALTLTSGYSSQYFTIWIDFNNDLLLTADEIVLQDFISASNTPTTFDFTVPSDAPGGVFVGRIATKWLSPAPDDPCGTYSYGNVADFMFSIGGGWLTAEPEMGTLLPGESIPVTVTFNSEGLEYGSHFANLNIETNNPFSAQPEVVVPVELVVAAPVQHILMPEGWSGWSSYIDPMMDAMFADVVAPVVDDMIITQYFTDVFYPAYGINTMGEFSHNHGYVTKMSAEATLSLEGMMVEPMVSFAAGWNLMPVLVPCNLSAADVFGGITGFIIAYEVAGNAMYYPAGEVYTLTELVPGKAYWVKVAAATDYTFPACDPEAKSSYIAPLRHANTTGWADVTYTGLSHIVVFDELASSMLVTGDVIGAFTADGTLAGMTIYNGTNASLALFGQDMTTAANDGFAEGEQLSFKLYRHANQTEYILDVIYSTKAPNYDGQFANHGLSIINDMSMTATGISTQELSGLTIYPNPSDGIFNIAVDHVSHDINWIITDAKGQVVTQGRLAESQIINLGDQPKGVYFIKFVGNDLLRVEKIVLR